MTRTIRLVLVVVAVGLAGVVQAQVPSATMTVDAVTVTPGGLSVTGVPVGAAAPVTVQFAITFSVTDAVKVAALEECHRSLLLALSKPGQYLAQVGQNICRVAVATP